LVRAGVVVGVVFVAVGATAIIFRDRIADIVFGGVFGPPVENGNGPIVPPEGSLCIPQFEFEIICLAVSQVAQDDFNRFMQYRVDYQNLTDQSFTFDSNGVSESNLFFFTEISLSLQVQRILSLFTIIEQNLQ